MPLPTHRDVHIDAPLSNIAVGWAQDQKVFVADRAFPRVPVAKQSDYYHKYKREYFFKDEARQRAPGTESQGGGWAMDDPGTYFCNEIAYHKDTPWEVRDNADTAIQVDKADTIFVTHKLLLRKERKFVDTYFGSGIWTSEFTGSASGGGGDFVFWDDYTNSNPALSIAKGQKKVKQLTGFKPNAMIVSEAVHFYLINNDKIIDRYKYTQAGIMTEALIAKVLGLDFYFIAGAIYSPEMEGETATYDWVWGNDALLYYRNMDNPSPFTPSAGYTFYWNKYGQDINIRRIPKPLSRADRLEGFYFEDYVIPSADLGLFYLNCISADATS